MEKFFFEKYAEKTIKKNELLFLYSHESQTTNLNINKINGETMITEVEGEITDTDDILMSNCVTEISKSHGEGTDDDDIFDLAGSTGTRENGEALDEDDFLLN
ncbi:MAG: hypothetical protein HF312_13155 [Ignavibacteria bacterium]|jgi:hypothetical protein|nr:hypothetical protein [Ignavibacteria bacterium]MCU7521161.1 hypothetical protein [Ignavibacteria bacterium]